MVAGCGVVVVIVYRLLPALARREVTEVDADL